ncbi:hypothetical protein CQ14_06825 [Bradyrhizobium lablabi]|uniref:Uncharacterized protein n=1 Tax=Bradyrhizobium lablabi TaxID=722472 RepID=A0A0R3MU74_9BRAD|nr:hypothetical protein [Bradyrhizobium lablabi]KRR21357.1 hypothetical protein CQ14_06825 [Bradyrhizobium lablabi]
MDARTPAQEKRFLPAAAEAIAQWFYPELENPNGPPRSVAVSDIDITKENIPTLPLVLVAFTQSLGHQLMRSSSSEFEITDTFVVEFWMPPQRVQHKNKDTPYWNYYPYEYIRDTLIAGFVNWEGPRGERVAYRGLHVEADPLAARLTFTFVATFQWCVDSLDMGTPFDVGFRLCTPASCIPDCTEEQEVDECQPCP